MPARIRKSHQDDVRAKIKAIALVSMLQRLAEKGEVDSGGGKFSKDWDPEKMRVRSTVALKLLNKIVPDLQSTQLTGEGSGGFALVVTPLETGK